MKLPIVKKLLALTSTATLLAGCSFNPATQTEMEVYGPALKPPNESVTETTTEPIRESVSLNKVNATTTLEQHTMSTYSLFKGTVNNTMSSLYENSMQNYDTFKENLTKIQAENSYNDNVITQDTDFLVTDEIVYDAQAEMQILVYGPNPEIVEPYDPNLELEICVYGPPTEIVEPKPYDPTDEEAICVYGPPTWFDDPLPFDPNDEKEICVYGPNLNN